VCVCVCVCGGGGAGVSLTSEIFKFEVRRNLKKIENRLISVIFLG